jgi:tellurite resistance protein TehA-like permease
MGSMSMLLTFIPILLYLAIFLFVLYIVLTIVRLMRERNQYLKDIRDELRKGNNSNEL